MAPNPCAMFFSSGSSLGRVGARHEIDDAAQHAEQRRRLRAHVRLAAVFERQHELAEALGVSTHVHQPAQRVFVERRIEIQAGADDVVPVRRLAGGSLAENVGVIDLLQVEMALAGRGPQPPDAAGRAHLVERFREDVQKGQPPIRIGAGVQRDEANHVVVQQRGGFADGLIGLGRCGAVHQQVVGHDAEGDRAL